VLWVASASTDRADLAEVRLKSEEPKYAFTDAEYAHTADAACAPTIERMCRWLEVSRSGYYEWRNRPPSATAQRRDLLKIEAPLEASDGTYGLRSASPFG
jgi:hypothetical protein